jgi:hypothetical protein
MGLSPTGWRRLYGPWSDFELAARTCTAWLLADMIDFACEEKDSARADRTGHHRVVPQRGRAAAGLTGGPIIVGVAGSRTCLSRHTCPFDTVHFGGVVRTLPSRLVSLGLDSCKVDRGLSHAISDSVGAPSLTSS